MTTRLVQESRAVQINKSCVLFFLVYLLTSCVPGRLADVKELPGKGAVVFGRVKVIKEGQPIDWGQGGGSFYTGQGWGFTAGFRVHIIPDAGPEPTPYRSYLRGDGSFYWHLPPGGYTITDFQWRSAGFSEDRYVSRGIFARFIIAELTSPIYIGTLTIRSWGGRYRMGVEDEYDQALQRLKQRFPEVKGPAAKRLMQLELR